MGGEEAGDELPKVGFIVQFTGDSVYEGKFFRIMQREPFEYVTGATTGTAEFSTVASGGNSGFKDITVLQSDKSHLRAVFVEMGFRDGMSYQVKLKSGTIRYGPDGDKNSARLNAIKTPFFDPDGTFAFWIFGQDWFPSIQANNITPWATTPIIYFKGYKYEMIQVTDTNVIAQLQASGKFSVLTLGGVPN